MNTVFLASDLSLLSFTGSEAPLSGAGFDKLLDYRLDTYWMTSVRTEQTLTISRPLAMTIDTIGVSGANFDELPPVIFEASLLPDFSVTQSLATFSASADCQVLTFPATDLPYTRLNFTLGAGGRPRISQLYLGTSFSVEASSLPFSVENIEANTNLGVSLYGNIRTGKILNPRVRASVRFDFLTEASRSAFIEVVSTTRGKTRPFFFRTSDGVSRFVRFLQDYTPVEIRGWNLNSTPLVEMRTQDTSDFWTLQGPNATGSGPPDMYGLPDLKYVTSVS